MTGRAVVCCVIFLSSLMSCGFLFAQDVCVEGNGILKSEQPSNMTPAEIIQRFAATESASKIRRDHYGYTLDVSVQTLDSDGQITGEYRQVSRITPDGKGGHAEKVTLAPRSTLRGLSLTKEDLDDIRDRLPLALTIDELPLFLVVYVGRQRVDQLDTYVFEISPQNAKKEKEKDRFTGRVWVDEQDLAVVKTCGKFREDENAGSTRKGARANLTPAVVTFREQIDGKLWFTTHAHADQFLRFPTHSVHLRETVRYSDYKPLENKEADLR